MIQYQFGKNEAGYPVAVVNIAEQTDPLKLMRSLKQVFPDLWQQVNLEIVAPQGVNGVNRILNSEGKP